MSAGRSGGLTWTEGPIQLSQPFAFVPQPDPDRQPYVAPHHAFIVLDTIEDGGGAVGRLSAIASMPAAYDVAIDEGVSVDIAPGARPPPSPPSRNKSRFTWASNSSNAGWAEAVTEASRVEDGEVQGGAAQAREPMAASQGVLRCAGAKSALHSGALHSP